MENRCCFCNKIIHSKKESKTHNCSQKQIVTEISNDIFMDEFKREKTKGIEVLFNIHPVKRR